MSGLSLAQGAGKSAVFEMPALKSPVFDIINTTSDNDITIHCRRGIQWCEARERAPCWQYRSGMTAPLKGSGDLDYLAVSKINAPRRFSSLILIAWMVCKSPCTCERATVKMLVLHIWFL